MTGSKTNSKNNDIDKRANSSSLRLFNSLTRQLEKFSPYHLGEARVYSCGPTVYDYPHIGNMRAYVFADTLGRALTFKGYRLTHVINITDVGHLTDDSDTGQDKIEKIAAQKDQSIHAIARHYTQAYWDDIKALNIRQPAHWPIATDYVAAMIDFAKCISDKYCYQLPSGLYFDTATLKDYGRLARAAIDTATLKDNGDTAKRETPRIDQVPGKRRSSDFAVWRTTPPGEDRQMEWDSPWGRGAPGWHLECSVMSEKLLGFPFDIHTGGIDHREIHHPNEIAQNQAYTKCNHSGARLWMHNNFLIERGGKMAKSKGEFLRLQLLIDRGFHPLAYRMMCLQAHYRSELEFSWPNLHAALIRLKRLLKATEAMRSSDSNPSDSKVLDLIPRAERAEKIQTAMEAFDAAISDDLNTAVALTCLEEVIAMKKVDWTHKAAAITDMDAVLGLKLTTSSRTDLRIRPKAATITEGEISEQLARRQRARTNRDFLVSDSIRATLAAHNVEVMDGDSSGWEWRLEI